jgi:hypothetical protein
VTIPTPAIDRCIFCGEPADSPVPLVHPLCALCQSEGQEVLVATIEMVERLIAERRTRLGAAA